MFYLRKINSQTPLNAHHYPKPLAIGFVHSPKNLLANCANGLGLRLLRGMIRRMAYLFSEIPFPSITPTQPVQGPSTSSTSSSSSSSAPPASEEVVAVSCTLTFCFDAFVALKGKCTGDTKPFCNKLYASHLSRVDT